MMSLGTKKPAPRPRAILSAEGEELLVKLLDTLPSPRSRRLGTVSFYSHGASGGASKEAGDGGGPRRMERTSLELCALPAPWRKRSQGGDDAQLPGGCSSVWVRVEDGSFLKHEDWAVRMRRGAKASSLSPAHFGKSMHLREVHAPSGDGRVTVITELTEALEAVAHDGRALRRCWSASACRPSRFRTFFCETDVT
jgi:hypothetical protein